MTTVDDRIAVGAGLEMPMPKEFATVEEERLHRKVQLAAAFRMFSKAGLDEGVAGHVTARDPEHTDSYWVNPFGMHFSLIKQSDLVRVNHAGEVIEGNRAVNGGPTSSPPRTRTGPTARRCPRSRRASRC
jgi:hypothetical protein